MERQEPVYYIVICFSVQKYCDVQRKSYAERHKGNPDMHLQREKLLGLAGVNTKKRGNKKSGESQSVTTS